MSLTETVEKLDGKAYLIAEIGVNHGGDLELAKRQIELAAASGCSAVKFQSYKADRLAAPNSPAYWSLSEESTKSQHQLFSKYDRFDYQHYAILAEHARELKVDFLSTPFDVKFARQLNNLVPFFKIASADITNKQLIRQIASTGKSILLSTGASNELEIERSIRWIKAVDNRIDICLLHCVLSYPADEFDANLALIKRLAELQDVALLGYSDHTKATPNLDVLLLAKQLGATVLEKHFTHDKSLKGNDHYHSMDASDVLAFRQAESRIEKLLGRESIRDVLPCEQSPRKQARRGIYAFRTIMEGEVITESCITCLRPSNEIEPADFFELIGKVAGRDIHAGESLRWSDFV